MSPLSPPAVGVVVTRSPLTDRVRPVSQETAAARPLKVLVYSDDRTVRQQVYLALGPRPSADLPDIEYTECATEPAVISAVDKGGFDLLILDGEAAPAGGLGIARQLKDEIYKCPPILVLVGRPQDAWLATWSRADAAVAHPINGIALAGEVIRLLAARQAVATV
jgi:DNA-binding response OmpR family regulator